MGPYAALWLFAALCLLLMLGYPVALTLAGTALAFAGLGLLFGGFDAALLNGFPSRVFGNILTNTTLVAVPLFVFMGGMLEKSRVADGLLLGMGRLFGRVRGGLGLSVVLVGMLLAASTGIVGATIVTMGLISLPSMLQRGYSVRLATGTICATGTLGQIIPPSIVLVLLGDILSSAYQQAQMKLGVFSPDAVSVGDLFVGAVIPGLLLVLLYVLYVAIISWLDPKAAPAHADDSAPLHWPSLLGALLPPLLLIAAVLGSILSGIATPTEAAGVGAFGALLLALAKRQLSWATLHAVSRQTVEVTAMVFLILVGASLFSLVFRGFGGEALINDFFQQLPGGRVAAIALVMVVIFLLGFVLDFIEITFVVVPIVAPLLLMMGVDPVWLGIMIAVNLQTSFLTPPFGFALFYLRGVAPDSVKTSDIYRGVMPFIALQLLLLAALAVWPGLVTWLPDVLYP